MKAGREARYPLAEVGPALLLLLTGGVLALIADSLDSDDDKFIAMGLLFAVAAAAVLYLDGRRREARARREIAIADEAVAAARSEVRRLDGLLRTIGDATPDLIFASDRQGRIRYANAALLRHMGIDSLSDLPPQDWAEVPAEVAGHRRNDQKVMEALRPMVFMEPFTTREGGLRMFRSSKAPVLSDDGNLWGVCGVATDVTDEHAALKALERSERYNRELTNALPHVVLSSRADGPGLYANDRAFEYLGIPPQVRGRAFWLECVHPADLDACRWEIENALRSRTPARTRMRCRRHDGVWRWMLVDVTPVPGDTEGRPLWICTATDIQDLVETEMEREAATRELEARKAFLKTVLETAPAAMVVADDDGNIHSFSRQAEELFGWTEAEARGQSLELLMPPVHRLGHAQQLKALVLEPERRTIGAERRVVGLRRDGTVFPMELNLGDFTDSGRRFFTGFIRDVTEREHREAHMQDLRSQIVHMAGVTAMGEVASAIIHEVAQPMAACSYYLAAVETPEAAHRLTYEQKVAALQGAASEARRAQEIVRRLRGLVQHGQAEKTAVDVAQVIRDGCTVATIGVAHVAVDLRLDEGLGSANLDAVQIQQVLVNLIRNAFQALTRTPDPRLVITARREAARLVVSVTDNGDGVPEAMRDRLFEPFSSQRPGGMGIGLSISRTIVEAHGGQIWCEPPVSGGGATFSFSIETAA